MANHMENSSIFSNKDFVQNLYILKKKNGRCCKINIIFVKNVKYLKKKHKFYENHLFNTTCRHNKTHYSFP